MEDCLVVWKTTRRVFADDWVQICLTMKVVSELSQDEYMTEVKKCIAVRRECGHTLKDVVCSILLGPKTRNQQQRTQVLCL